MSDTESNKGSNGNGNGNGNGGKRFEEELAEKQPIPFVILNGFLKICFVVYDALMYIPFKLFADPKERIELSERVKVKISFF